MYIGIHVKYLLLLSDFNETWNFSKDFPKVIKYQISWESLQSEPSSCVQTDKRADIHKEANSRVSQILRTRQKNSIQEVKITNTVTEQSGSQDASSDVGGCTVKTLARRLTIPEVSRRFPQLLQAESVTVS
jgi:hypothetical protein